MPKSVIPSKRYHALHDLLALSFQEARQPGADPIAVERVKAMVSILNAAYKDGVVSLDFSRDFHNVIADILGPDKIRPEGLNKDQRVLEFGMEALRISFGGIAVK